MDLFTNEDGSLDIYIQNTDPHGDQRSNSLPDMMLLFLCKGGCTGLKQKRWMVPGNYRRCYG